MSWVELLYSSKNDKNLLDNLYRVKHLEEISPTGGSVVIPSAAMRQRELFYFWLPLSASWLLMTAEGPMLSAVINRLPDEVEILAALGVVLTLAITIESPIMGLLSTSTTLVRDRPSYLLVRRFTWHWMLGLTAVAALLGWTPLFDLVVLRVLGTPAEVARWVEPGLRILVPWTAAIAWRRFLQGAIIRFGSTRPIAWGTALRLVSTVSVGVGLALWGRVSGIHLAATALLTGVVVEALYTTWVARRVLRRHLPDISADTAADAAPLTYRALASFHWPLATTSMLGLAAQPLTTFTLARLEHPTLTLAAWPLVYHVALWMRAPAFAMPELVIAKSAEPGAADALRRFAWRVAGAATLVMAAFALTPIGDFYLGRLLDAPPEIVALGKAGLLLFIPLPALATLGMWTRGVLIQARRTPLVHRAMVYTLSVLAGTLGVGLVLHWPGIPTAALSMNLAALTLFVYGWFHVRRLPGEEGGERLAQMKSIG